MDFRIEQPYWLLLAVPAAIYLAWTYRRSVKGGGRRGVVLLLLRSTAAACLIIAASSPHLLLGSGRQQIFILADRSVSMDGSEDGVESWLSGAAAGKKENQDVRILSFAGSVREGSKGGGLRKESGPGGAGETDLEQAIRHAAAAAGGKPARIVLLTDGRETRGDALAYARSVLPPHITVDAVEFSPPPREDAAVSSFRIPPSGRAGEVLDLEVTVESTAAATGRLLLFKEDRLAEERTVELSEGENRFLFKETQDDEGFIRYEAQIITEGDGIGENNKMNAVTDIAGPPRFLLVGQDNSPSPIGKWIGNEKVRVDSIGAEELPNDLAAYLSYDGIIFDNIPGHLVGEDRMGLIQEAVKTFGTGFMMVGGEESFGLGGYYRTPIEELLPVSMDVTGTHIIPSLGLVIVLDRSGSMMGTKLDMAKEAASRSAALLRPDDTLGFIAFDDEPWEVIETGPVGDPAKALESIQSVITGGGTDLFPAVRLAVERLSEADAQRKHVILLTDGMSAEGGDYEGVLKQAASNNITVSSVAIGSDADRVLLSRLADLGSGRFYDVRDADAVPAILSRETAMLSRTFIVDEPFRPAVRPTEGWEVLSGSLPEMNAYIAVTAKPSADVIMESPLEDPVIAEWMYGLGRTVAYTSGSGGWSGGFAGWEDWPRLWTAAAARLLPSYREEPFEVTRSEDGSYLVTGSGRSSFLDVAVVDAKGNEIEASVDPTGPGSARVRFDPAPGLVFFRISGDGETYAKVGLSVPYGSEYRPGPPDGKLLEALAEETGGRMVEKPAEALRTQERKQWETAPAWRWFALSSMLLFFADITLRRFGSPSATVNKRRRMKESPGAPAAGPSHIQRLLDEKRKSE
ncbi:VWA domain-containing protein [Bhargavaea ullalensis]|uniref:Mg-chelatase subunit ChlD n=1 Tax=Bhargavaea ullalensis TaxID=1265685 RepID=A0ABV2GBX3_9BACL